MPLPPAPAPQTTWLNSQELRRHLGIGKTTLSDLLSTGVLRPGTHFIRKGGSTRGPALFDLDAVEKEFRELAARRGKVDPIASAAAAYRAALWRVAPSSRQTIV